MGFNSAFKGLRLDTQESPFMETEDSLATLIRTCFEPRSGPRH